MRNFTALSEYLTTCMAFVLFAMIYYGVMALVVDVNIVKVAEEDKKKKPSYLNSNQISPQEEEKTKKDGNFAQELFQKWDRRVFVTYNVMFIAFNIFYFSIHLA